MSIWRELRRRSVFKVGMAYLAVSWLIIQVVANVNDPLNLPGQFDTVVVVLLAIGFPVALVFAWAFDLTAEGIRRAPTEHSSAPLASTARGHRLNYFISGVLALAVAFLLFDRFVEPAGENATPADTNASGSGPGSTATAADPAAQTTDLCTPTQQIISIAVLPLRALTSETETEDAARALTAALTYRLQAVPEFRVTSARDVRRYDDSQLSLSEIGAELGADYLIDGTLAGDGARLSFNLNLTRAASNEVIWSPGNREFVRAEIFDVQDDVAEQVALASRVGLTFQNAPAGMTGSIDSYFAFLAAMDAWSSGTADSPLKARELLHRSIALDDTFVGPYIYLDIVLQGMIASATGTERDQYLRERQEAGDKLRTLETDDGRSLFAEFSRSLLDGDWFRVRDIRQQIREDGDCTEVRRTYYQVSAFLDVSVGRANASIDAMEAFQALMPAEAADNTLFYLGLAYISAGRLDAAEAVYERAVASGASFSPNMRDSLLRIAMTKHDRALIDARLAENEAAGIPRPAISTFLDDRDAGIAEIRRILGSGTPLNETGATSLAYWAAYFGDAPLALELLSSTDPRPASFAIRFAIWHPLMADVRKLAGFNDIVTNMGLVAYWREYGWPDYCHPIGDDFECE